MPRFAPKPIVLAVAMALALAACGGDDEPTAPYAGAFDVGELDTTMDPCVDVGAFVNNRWQAAHPIPADKSFVSTLQVLQDQSDALQREILENAAAGVDTAPANSIERKLGLLYRAGLDEAALDAAGVQPVASALARVDQLQSPTDIAAYLTERAAQGQSAVLDVAPLQDYLDPHMVIAAVSPAALALPTPAHYSEPDYADIVQAYRDYLRTLLTLAGEDAASAARQADWALALETRLAAVSPSPEELAHPDTWYAPVSVQEANRITPHFDWYAFLAGQGLAPATFSLIAQPYFAEFDRMLLDVPAEQWRAYLRLQVLDGAATLLSRPFRDAYFAFYRRTLAGVQTPVPRWRAVLNDINGVMSEALGQLYVARAFPPEARARAERVVQDVKAAMRERLRNVAWMTDATRRQAVDKLDKMQTLVGYPDAWPDWSQAVVSDEGYYASIASLNAFNHRRLLARIGKPPQPGIWDFPPQKVNAFYDPQVNSINFPAAIVQPPFFSPDADPALNFGGLGSVAGHEMTHAFDPNGSLFDGDGRRVDWWTPADSAAFQARTGLLVQQFDQYQPFPDQPAVRVNGELTLPENVADLGGLNAAYDALQRTLAGNPFLARANIDGYSQDQRFFMGWARNWRVNYRPQQLRVLLESDPHAPGAFRAIGTPSNMPAFADAFACQAGDPMVRPPEQQITIW